MKKLDDYQKYLPILSKAKLFEGIPLEHYPQIFNFLQAFTQTALAEFLGVNRSALSRELGRMQDENLIEVNDKKMKLLL